MVLNFLFAVRRRIGFVRFCLSFLFLIAIAAVSGCGSSYQPPSITSGPRKVWARPRAVIATHTGVIGKSVEGRDIACSVYGDGEDVVLVIATIHGNESAGTPIVVRLKRELEQRRRLVLGRKVVLVEMLNPDGFARRQRTNANGVDLNRNFAAANRVNNRINGRSAFCEPESRVIENLIKRHRPDRIIVFHEALNCIDYDGPGRSLAKHMAGFCDIKVKKLGARAGSLGAYAGETLGIPVITVELKPDDAGQSAQTLWQRYGTMLVAGITYPSNPFGIAK